MINIEGNTLEKLYQPHNRYFSPNTPFLYLCLLQHEGFIKEKYICEMNDEETLIERKTRK